jgi:hypothetical protein
MEKEDEQYFSASDPESYLMRNFENLDDDMSVDENSSLFSGQKTRSQLRPPPHRRTASNRSNRNGVRSQRLAGVFDSAAVPG